MKIVCMVIFLVTIIISTGSVSESQCLDDFDCGFCEKCQAGACVFQTNLEDVKAECRQYCFTGFCGGDGVCGLSPVWAAVCSDDGYTDTDDQCDGNGTCEHLGSQWARTV